MARSFNKMWKKVTGRDYAHSPISLNDEQLKSLPTILVQCQVGYNSHVQACAATVVRQLTLWLLLGGGSLTTCEWILLCRILTALWAMSGTWTLLPRRTSSLPSLPPTIWSFLPEPNNTPVESILQKLVVESWDPTLCRATTLSLTGKTAGLDLRKALAPTIERTRLKIPKTAGTPTIAVWESQSLVKCALRLWTSSCVTTIPP